MSAAAGNLGDRASILPLTDVKIVLWVLNFAHRDIAGLAVGHLPIETLSNGPLGRPNIFCCRRRLPAAAAGGGTGESDGK